MSSPSATQPKKKKSIGSKIKRFFLWVLGGLFFLILLVFFGSSFFSNKIGNAVVTELNKSLKNGIEVQDYDLTLVKYFPNAAVSLKNVKVPDAENDKMLLEANELAFRFGLFSLFGSKININSVVINDGAMFVEVDKKGQANYDIFKNNEEETSSSEGTELKLKLEEAKLNDIEIIYVDKKNDQNLMMNLYEANMSGEFSGDRFVLTSDAAFKTDFFETSDGRYLLGKNISYKADVDVDLKNENYKFKECLLNIEENKFSVTGDIVKDKKGLLYDLDFDGKDCTLQSLISLLPEETMEQLEGLKSKGDFKFNGTVKGHAGKQQPAIRVELGLTDGRISGPQLKSPFKDLTFNATFTNGKNRSNTSSILEISNFKGYLDREIIELTAKISNLDKPYIDASFNGAISLDAISGFFTSDAITGADGDLEVNNFEIHGLLEEMTDPDLVYKIKSQGEIEFDDAMIKVNKEKITFDKGKINISDNLLNINDVKIEGVGSEIKINGSFQNLIPVLLSDSINSQDAQLIFDATLTADELDIERWINISDIPSSGTDEKVIDSLKTKQIEQREALSNFLDGVFRCDIKTFNYGKITGEEFNGELKVKNNELLINGGVKAMDGDFTLDGIIRLKEEPKLNAKLLCRNVDGKRFFRETDNFGQDVLIYKNIKGRIDANIAIEAVWDSKGEFLTDQLHVLADTEIRDGELIDFKMLEDFSTYVKMKDLRHIYFTKTRNWFEVKNEVLHLPKMLIQNNALNLVLSGKHTFDQDIDYNVKVNAGQVVMKKLFKKAGRKPIKARNGWFNLYYKIKGNLDDYDMESAKREVKRDFEMSEKRKEKIKQKLAQAFNHIDQLTEERVNDEDDSSGETMSE